MFERIVVPSRARRPWRSMVLGVSVIAHVGMLVALLVAGMWQVERLSPPKRQLTFAVSGLPRMEAAAPPAQKRVETPKLTKRRPATLTQPVRAPMEDIEVEIATSDPTGDDTSQGLGTGPGTGSGSPFGEIGDKPVELPPIEPIKPPPAPPPAPAVVPASVLDGKRIAGNAQIMPPDSVQLTMVRDGAHRLDATIKMCLDQEGQVRSLEVLASTGHDDYDQKLVAEMRGWRYEPYRAGDKPIPVCTSIHFVYVMQ